MEFTQWLFTRSRPPAAEQVWLAGKNKWVMDAWTASWIWAQDNFCTQSRGRWIKATSLPLVLSLGGGELVDSSSQGRPVKRNEVWEWQPKAVLRWPRPCFSHQSHAASLDEDIFGRGWEREQQKRNLEQLITLPAEVGQLRNQREKQGSLPQSTQSPERNSTNRVIFANEGF